MLSLNVLNCQMGHSLCEDQVIPWAFQREDRGYSAHTVTCFGQQVIGNLHWHKEKGILLSQQEFMPN